MKLTQQNKKLSTVFPPTAYYIAAGLITIITFPAPSRLGHWMSSLGWWVIPIVALLIYLGNKSHQQRLEPDLPKPVIEPNNNAETSESEQTKIDHGHDNSNKKNRRDVAKPYYATVKENDEDITETEIPRYTVSKSNKNMGAKPNQNIEKSYVRYASQITNVSMYLFSHKCCPPKDDHAKIDLENEHNRTGLVSAIVSRINALGLVDCSHEDQASILRDMAKDDVENVATTSDTESDAGMILTILNLVDMLVRHQHDLYPEYKPMLEMVNQLAKICPSGMQVIFGDDLPIEVRRTFTHFSSLFEQNRANSNF